jgi:L-iditol 2-dehydrogenase
MSDMRAAVLDGIRKVRVAGVPCRAPGADEVLLKVRAVGICGSDLHYYTEGGIGGQVVDKPFTPGHEIAAEVTDAAAGALGLPAGTLVAVEPNHACGHCEWCARGEDNLCPHTAFAGAPPHPGAMSEYFVAPKRSVIPVPASFDAAATAMLEPLGVALHALDLAHLEPGETVAVLGCGPIGLAAVRLARRGGAGAVYAIDPVPARTQRARALGAEEVAAGHAEIARWTDGRGVDLVIEISDAAQALQQAAEAARIGGRVVIAGIPEGGRYVLEASVARRRQLAIQMVRRMPHIWQRVIDLVARGDVDARALVTHQFALDEAPAAFALAAARGEGVVKTVVCP